LSTTSVNSPAPPARQPALNLSRLVALSTAGLASLIVFAALLLSR